jgi:hypothetical protein
MMKASPQSIKPRATEDGDGIAREMFSPADLQMSPEEYAARHAHLWACFGLDRYRYRDPILGDWVRRFGEILNSTDEVELCRQRFLTPAELATVRKQQAEEF